VKVVIVAQKARGSQDVEIGVAWANEARKTLSI